MFHLFYIADLLEDMIRLPTEEERDRTLQMLEIDSENPVKRDQLERRHRRRQRLCVNQAHGQDG